MSCFSIRPFDKHEFINHLQSHGPPKITFNSTLGKSGWVEMYSRFLESPNFIGWLRDRKRVTERQIRQQYLDQISKLTTDTSDIDIFLLLRQELCWAGCDPVSSNSEPISDNGPMDSMREDSGTFLFPNYKYRQEFQTRAKIIWGTFKPHVRAAFKQGLFDMYLVFPPNKDDEFIMVI